jgi:hypothetical protein
VGARLTRVNHFETQSFLRNQSELPDELSPDAQLPATAGGG